LTLAHRHATLTGTGAQYCPSERHQTTANNKKVALLLDRRNAEYWQPRRRFRPPRQGNGDQA